ncbi:MAG TPA: proline racemase family protein [Jatrophihabitans sp.]|nr:proline racemase family protein [Jatrophihabitans sp.]
MISVVGCHAAGETMFEKKLTMEREHDHIRRMLLCEPRGSVSRHVNLIVAPTRDDCDAGVIIMEPTEYPPMSGSNTIASVTVLLETGIVPMTEPVTVVRLDMPGGVVVATATCSGGKCVSVEFENVPSFVYQLDAELHVDGVGTVIADVAYGGMNYAIVAAEQLGLRVDASEARELAILADKIRVAARTQLEIVHPANPGIRDVTMVQFAGPYQGSGRVTRNTCVLAPGRSDRSPTGTGTSARMAVLRARGLMDVGDTLIHSSIIGSQFVGTVKADTSIGDVPAIIPTVKGSAWITGFHNYVVDTSDPFPTGYVVADTWGVTGSLDQ